MATAEVAPKLLSRLQATARPRWPAAFYDASSALLGLCVVVVPALPDTRATLPLRLMGRDGQLEAAMREVAALPVEAWERRVARAVVEFLKRRRKQEQSMSARTDYLRKQWDDSIAEATQKGLREGLKVGRTEGLGPLEHLFARRLGRALTAEEHATLRVRLDTVGPARLGDVVLDLTPAALAAWLADPAAT